MCKTIILCHRCQQKCSITALWCLDSVHTHPLSSMVSTNGNSFTKISSPESLQIASNNTVDICWSPDWSQGSQIDQTRHSHAQIPSGRAHLVLLLRLSTVCKKDLWAWSSSRVEQSSSSSSMIPHCTQRRRGSRCPALHTQAVARDWGNSSITKGSRWAGSVSMLVAMVNGGPNARMTSCRE